MTAEVQPLVRAVYGFNWARLEDRDRSLEALGQLVAPKFELHLSPEIGARAIRSLSELRELTAAIEQDFEECVYSLEEVLEGTDGRVVVTGTISGRGRASKLPLGGSFAHVWTVRDGRAATCLAFREREQALAAAGISP
jgi:ketosteroid isomerase-like protein